VRGLLPRVGAIAAAVLFVGACAAEPGDSTAHKDKVVTIQADYPEYETADALYGAATLVIDGQLTGASKVLREVPDPNAGGSDPKLNPNAGAPAGNAQAAQPPDSTIVTVYEVKVLAVHKGEAKVGEIVDIKTLGGVFDGVTYQEIGVSPLKAGQPYLLFLETYPTSPAAMLNPAQAQYAIGADGGVTALPGNPLKLTRATLDRLTK
jgi:hypothetical protein